MKRGSRPTPNGKEPLVAARSEFREKTQKVGGGLDRSSRERAPGVRFFLKKDEAMVWARMYGKPVWSIDKFSGMGDNAGAKYFVVASYDAFWELYQQPPRQEYGDPNFAPDHGWKEYDSLQDLRKSDFRGHKLKDEEDRRQRLLEGCLKIYPFAYEVMMEGVPLHLYLDIEASRETNPGVNLEELAEKLLAELRAFMCQMRLGVPEADLLSPEIVILDSSTDRKFSKHVVYKIPNALFANNYLCGALMRNFHLHLIQRFGPPTENKFYVHPEKDAKSDIMVCLLDFAVYTKNRDFRLIGSCKRKGCENPRTLLRWLWVQNRKHELTKELFLQCLLQNADDAQVKRHISCVVDTINSGIPISSSLRTFQPLRASSALSSSASDPRYSIPTLSSDNVSVRGENSGLMFPQSVISQLEKLGGRVSHWLKNTNQTPFPDYFRRGDVKKVQVRRLRDGNYAWAVQTNSKFCVIRKERQKVGEHSNRTAQFMVWITGLCKDGVYDKNKVGRIKQCCIARSCTGEQKRSEWSNWIGRGLPDNLLEAIDLLTATHIASEIKRLGASCVAAGTAATTTCIFVEDD